jgi:hypothetical protein
LQQFLFPYSPFYITTCFGLYRPSSSGIYIQSFLEAIKPTTDPFLGYTVYIYIYILGLFLILLCNILYLKFKIEIADNVLKYLFYLNMLSS